MIHSHLIVLSIIFKALVMCFSTAFSDTPRIDAISLLVLPSCLLRMKTSRHRGGSPLTLSLRLLISSSYIVFSSGVHEPLKSAEYRNSSHMSANDSDMKRPFLALSPLNLSRHPFLNIVNSRDDHLDEEVPLYFSQSLTNVS